jgi:hypothetical protein
MCRWCFDIGSVLIANDEGIQGQRMKPSKS